VKTVAEGLGLPLHLLPTPVPIMRLLVRAMSALSSRALSTPSQLRMLEDGMVGDPEPARRDLALEPRPFTAEAIRDTVKPIPPLFRMSLRLLPTGADRAWLAAQRPAFARALGLAFAAVLLFPFTQLVLENVWYRMALAGGVFSAAAFADVPLPWRELYRVTPKGLLQGAAAAVLLYGIGGIVFHLLRHVAGAAAQIQSLYAWRDGLPLAVTLPLLVWIVLAEEIVWRNAVTLPLAARCGPVAGALLAAALFAAAHVSLGVPLLLAAALGAGFYWSALVVLTRSAVPALVSHLLWDVAVMFALPYGR
jgi:membrane protease YdiL (CAAX protease family)